ncbi:hypothetical protein ABPG72_001117, partial [Tetrahymena utriculariae]
IQLYNISIINSTLGQTFTFFQQKTNTQAEIVNLTILNNICSNNTKQVEDIASALFSAGLYTVNGVLIS